MPNIKPDQRSREQRLLDFVQLVAIGDAGPLGAQLLLQQLKAPEAGPAVWKRLNVMSYEFGFDTEKARLCGEAAQCIQAMSAALRAILLQVSQGKVLERDACITQARAALAKANCE